MPTITFDLDETLIHGRHHFTIILQSDDPVLVQRVLTFVSVQEGVAN